MDDFKIIARLLAAIRASEAMSAFNTALVDEKTLHATTTHRDNLAIKLQKAGYIEGLFVVDDMDNQTVPVVLWDASKPSVTLKGLEYIRENATLRKAIKEIKDTGIEAAAKIVTNVIQNQF